MCRISHSFILFHLSLLVILLITHLLADTDIITSLVIRECQWLCNSAGSVGILTVELSLASLNARKAIHAHRNTTRRTLQHVSSSVKNGVRDMIRTEPVGTKVAEHAGSILNTSTTVRCLGGLGWRCTMKALVVTIDCLTVIADGYLLLIGPVRCRVCHSLLQVATDTAIMEVPLALLALHGGRSEIFRRPARLSTLLACSTFP
ncbi:hypothetical protein J8273_6123 [Carpediemonas membranifera]|uniref:Secreted protein n=1 Tax=Carpediemonas membranifera TaxID=201153 RepID=A0A8J6ASP1_9EUKA|nr:hypothetical protein J8273_6123 [Carpediemonas membranifera]|eukprot:KAG9391370.1 hypothetical protein J8273_6123 [Carpediemonas membranifera]